MEVFGFGLMNSVGFGRKPLHSPIVFQIQMKDGCTLI
jgi:hypothetical protein